MSERIIQRIREASEPLLPRPVDCEPRVSALPEIRAVLVDVYGTLLVSASGDIGSADASVRGRAAVDALGAVGMALDAPPEQVDESWTGVIAAEHARLRGAGIPYPEVDVREIWPVVCQRIAEASSLSPISARRVDRLDWSQLAVEFEVRVNPVWPMPEAAETLQRLADRGRVMGIVSNAQFFTPLAWTATAGKSLGECGVAASLRYYSYEHREAKPGRGLYQRAVAGLAEAGIAPSETLYVGNDMRNDIWPAAAVGFRTALFAGDERSLRRRDETPRHERGPDPDVVITQWPQILEVATDA
ncbi:MAG: HAD family hydrolase [Planctomycetales bacterium]|nr:HAD family hydrolase [Planctomycetales bacterium]